MFPFFIISSLAFIFLGWYATRKKINPITIYNAIWLLVVLLYQIRLSGFQPEIDDQTYGLLVLKSFTFTISFLIFYLFKFKFHLPHRKNKPHKISGVRSFFTTLDYRKVLTPIFLGWCVVEIFETIYSGGLPIIWKLTGDPRTYFDYGVSTLHGLMNAVGLVVITLSFLAFLKEKDRKQRGVFLAMIAICLGFYLCIITRQVLISAVIQMLVIYALTKRPLNKKKFIFGLASVALAGIIVFGIIGNIRTGYDGFISVAGIDTNVPPIFVGFYWVYMYLTMSLANINNAVVLGINHFGGIYPAAKVFLPTVLSRAIFSPNVAVSVPDYLMTQAFNVSGYFIDFYVGMGVLGVVMIAAIYGLLGGVIFKMLQKNASEKRIVLYAVYLQIIILSFFFNHLLYLPSGFQLILVLVIYYFLGKKAKNGES